MVLAIARGIAIFEGSEAQYLDAAAKILFQPTNVPSLTERYSNIITAALTDYFKNQTLHKVTSGKNEKSVSDLMIMGLLQGVLDKNRARNQSDSKQETLSAEKMRFVLFLGTTIAAACMSIFYKVSVVNAAEWYYNHVPDNLVVNPSEFFNAMLYTAIASAVDKGIEAVQLAIRDVDPLKTAPRSFFDAFVTALKTQNRTRQTFAALLSAACLSFKIRNGFPTPSDMPAEYASAEFTSLTDRMLGTIPYRTMILGMLAEQVPLVIPHVYAQLTTPDKVLAVGNVLLDEIEKKSDVVELVPASAFERKLTITTVSSMDVHFKEENAPRVHVHISTGIDNSCEVYLAEANTEEGSTRLTKTDTGATIINKSNAASASFIAYSSAAVLDSISTWQSSGSPEGTFSASAFASAYDLHTAMLVQHYAFGGNETINRTWLQDPDLDIMKSFATSPDELLGMLATAVAPQQRHTVDLPYDDFLTYTAASAHNIPTKSSVGVALRTGTIQYMTRSLLPCLCAEARSQQAKDHLNVKISYTRHLAASKALYTGLNALIGSVSMTQYLEDFVKAPSALEEFLLIGGENAVKFLKHIGIGVSASSKAGYFVQFGRAYDMVGVADTVAWKQHIQVLHSSRSILRILSDAMLYSSILNSRTKDSDILRMRLAEDLLATFKMWAMLEPVLMRAKQTIASDAQLDHFGLSLGHYLRHAVFFDLNALMLIRFTLSGLANKEQVVAKLYPVLDDLRNYVVALNPLAVGSDHGLFR
jgi:hypothetical protein